MQVMTWWIRVWLLAVTVCDCVWLLNDCKWLVSWMRLIASGNNDRLSSPRDSEWMCVFVHDFGVICQGIHLIASAGYSYQVWLRVICGKWEYFCAIVRLGEFLFPIYNWVRAIVCKTVRGWEGMLLQRELRWEVCQLSPAKSFLEVGTI